MKRIKLAALTLAAALVLPASAVAGVVWNESGPSGAGDLLASAQTTYDSSYNTLSGISGTLTSSVPVGGSPRHQVDLYKIRIGDAASFSAKTRDTGFDTALFLFNSSGLGVYMNDDMPDFSGLTSLLPAGDANSPVANGIYYLAVALGGFIAQDGSGFSLFTNGGGFNDVLGADPSSGALAGWADRFGSFSESPLNYFIELTGATTGELPEPGSLLLLLGAGLAAVVVRRRGSRR